ncbi:MAG: hypothetical protein EZS28_004509 [Streblomastix strix]|uniref:Uncharacterized protein n=1 Tax=Streblomastix strix TaxID=222440 RepID=A0A5J4WYN8_9EUKA|nr:MAG: hypothetical protein EZS28_004509 [Streblomastix strix]
MVREDHTSQIFFTTPLTTILTSTHTERNIAIFRPISPEDPRGSKEKEPKRQQPKPQQYARLIDVVERFKEIMKLIIEEKKKKPKVMLPGLYKEYQNKDDPVIFYPPKNDVVAGFFNIHPQIYQSKLEAIRGLIIFAAKQIVQSETQSKNQKQLSNKQEIIVAVGTNDNEDNDQSEHAIKPKNFTNGNDGLRKNDSGTQLQATVNGEAKPKISITQISTNTPPHNVFGSDRLVGNVTGSLRTTLSEQELGNQNISYSRSQPPLIAIPPELDQVKGKIVVPKQRMQPNNDLDTRSNTGQPKTVADKSLGNPEPRANIDISKYFIFQQEQRKRQIQHQLVKTSLQNIPKATIPVQDPRNRNKDSTPKTRQKQSLNSKLTSRISWTEQEGKEERRMGRDLVNREMNKENKGILDTITGTDSQILGIMGYNQID